MGGRGRLRPVPASGICGSPTGSRVREPRGQGGTYGNRIASRVADGRGERRPHGRHGGAGGGADTAAAGRVRARGQGGAPRRSSVHPARVLADHAVDRAVLLDVAGHVEPGRPAPLPPGFGITARHLDETMKAQGVDVQRGDSLLIRTGWGPYFGTDNAKYLGEQSPGPGQDAARWIIARGVRLAGDDTATFEKRPAAYGKELFSVHMMLLADNGIYIVENANLEPLSAARAHVVCLIVAPLRIQGASGSPLRVIALAP